MQIPVPKPYSIPGEKVVGYDRAGDPIVKVSGITYPRLEMLWIFADCQGNRIGLHGKHSDGLDASWSSVYADDGAPIEFLSIYEQWRLLCKAGQK